jgi:hypothetical protein
MMPRLGVTYESDIEIISKPKTEHQPDEYFALDLPVAPAIMVNNEIVVESGNISQEDVEACICRHLEMVKKDEPSSLYSQGGAYVHNEAVSQRESRLSELQEGYRCSQKNAGNFQG